MLIQKINNTHYALKSEQLAKKYPKTNQYLADLDTQKEGLLAHTIQELQKQIPETEESKLSDSLQLTEMIVSETETDRYTVPAAFLYAAFNSYKDKQIIDANFQPLIYEIAHSVFKFPDISKMNFSEESDNFIQLLLTVMGDVRALIIRLFEQLRRTRNALNAQQEIQLKIAAQNMAVFAPAAHRVGLYKVKEELENISLQFMKPQVYQSVLDKLQGSKADREMFIQNFIRPIKQSLDAEDYKYTIKWRTKSVFSIWNKMVKKKVAFEEVYDLFAIRIILDSKPENEIKDCWNAYSIVVQHYKPDTSRLRDWISFPKSSGYESLQTTVYGKNDRPVEVQIRTVRMDDIAENGPAAHWKYKGVQKGDSNLWLENMRKAIENPNLKEKSDLFKAGKEAPEVYIITPKGDLLALQAGYTIIDLAFLIHTEVGETCTGAMVNGKIQSVAYQPKNGDRIKILTDKKTKPGKDWLQVAQSNTAKIRIKRSLNMNLYTRADEGKELLKSKLTQLKLDFSDKHLTKLKKHGKFSSSLEMFHAYAEGKAETKQIRSILLDEDEKPKEIDIENISFDSNEFETPKDASDYLIIDTNLSSVEYKLAKCCKPLPGDKIFGFNTANRGLKIHKSTCPNAKDMYTRHPYRVAEARWREQIKSGKFIADILITGNDTVGMAAAISQQITDLDQIKLKGIALKSAENGSFRGTIAVQVPSRSRLNKLIISLRRIKGVAQVREKRS